MIPKGAQPILDARMRGKRPEHPVIVNLTQRWCSYEPWIKARPNHTYDWEWARALDVIIVAESGDSIISTVEGVGKVTGGLRVWLIDREVGWDVSVWPNPDDVWKSPDKWRWQIHHTKMYPSDIEHLQQFVRENFQ